MDIIALLKAERDKAAQQVNALDTAIRALSGMNSTGHARRMSAAVTFHYVSQPMCPPLLIIEAWVILHQCSARFALRN